MYLADNLKKQRVLMVVKTYPNLSQKYGELVCTAGLTECGQWIRIYPIRFRKLDEFKKFSKYQWIEIDLLRNKTDFRIESYRPLKNDANIKIVDSISTDNNWEERKKIVQKSKIYHSLSELIDIFRTSQISLATVKPKEIKDFVFEPENEKYWSEKQVAYFTQPQFFEVVPSKPNLRKLPYKFKYIFSTEDGKERKIMIEDWEVGALYWNCLKRYATEKIALQKVKEKYLTHFIHNKDLLFFMGTTHRHHNVARNPFIIIGTFHPPKIKDDMQLKLF
ncbi:MAG: hypothetical protein R6U84_03870 [Candidatus Cloacimonadales bacterium]